MILTSLTISCIIISFLLILLFGSLIIHLAAKFSFVKNATFGKAFKACLVTAVVSFIINIVLMFIPPLGPVLGFFISLLVTLYILKSIYDTGWIQALVIWFMEWVVIVLIVIIIAAIMGVAIVI
ncbi:MAG TPA: hypothetical protein QF753_21220 [Victivallales bacterium]|nr:hypothetical protein [Victivallales bacterium]